jgi:hypothetical protein
VFDLHPFLVARGFGQLCLRPILGLKSGRRENQNGERENESLHKNAS